MTARLDLPNMDGPDPPFLPYKVGPDPPSLPYKVGRDPPTTEFTDVHVYLTRTWWIEGSI